MFNKIINFKDDALSASVQTLVNSKIKDFGEMLKFNLDSKNKTIELEVILDGEKEPLDVKIDNYEITKEDGKYYISVKNIATSRKWINVVASEYLNSQKFEIPAKYAKILKLIV